MNFIRYILLETQLGSAAQPKVHQSDAVDNTATILNSSFDELVELSNAAMQGTKDLKFLDYWNAWDDGSWSGIDLSDPNQDLDEKMKKKQKADEKKAERLRLIEEKKILRSSALEASRLEDAADTSPQVDSTETTEAPQPKPRPFIGQIMKNMGLSEAGAHLSDPLGIVDDELEKPFTSNSTPMMAQHILASLDSGGSGGQFVGLIQDYIEPVQPWIAELKRIQTIKKSYSSLEQE